MWIFTNRGLISVVQHRENKELLLVRARQKGLLENLSTAVPLDVFEDPSADYPFRAWASRMTLVEILYGEVERVDYSNFKESVLDSFLHNLYYRVYTVMSLLNNHPVVKPEKPVSKDSVYGASLEELI